MKPMSPLKLEGNIAENWRKWKLRWSLYAKASGADKQEATQCAIFLHTIGEEALEVHDMFSFTEEQKDKLVPIIEEFEAYCSPKKNTTYERYIFNSCTQNGRTIDAFVTDLRSKAKTCEFGDLQDSLIRDRNVCGIDDNNTRERLLRNNALTLEKAIDAVRAAETSKTQTQELNNSVEAAALTNDRRLTNPKYPVTGTRSGYRSGFKIDTGAQCNVIPEHTFAKFAIKPALRRTNTKLTA